jgi:hypothetical protein
MISELVDLWYSIYGLIAGWGITTTALIVAVVFLWLRVRVLERKHDHLYNRFVTSERERSLLERQDKI